MKPLVTILGIFLLTLLFAFIIYNIPPFHERLAWRVDAIQARVKYALSPPEEVVFVPSQRLGTTALPATASPAPTYTLTATTAPLPESTTLPSPTPTPTVTITPIPDEVYIPGVRHEFQTWNNCGPATLSMALTFWGWEGDQRPIAAFTKPNPRDKNVMPEEMASFVEEQTEFMVLVRVGGQIQTLKEFLAAGFPVIVEKGIEDNDGWLGHYVLVSGYNDASQTYLYQDSLNGADRSIGYDVLERQWRAFNYTYLVVFPASREDEALAVLGDQADKTHNYHSAYQKSSEEIVLLDGRDLYFAWFNRGTNQVGLQDYSGAALAYDQAFALYADLPGKERPWRMMWYQTGPYLAYFYTGRYEDVINLATSTLNAMSEPVLEESYYWRALAREALGDTEGAVKDLKTSLVHHPGFRPSLYQLDRLGIRD
jgi:hypothetical protein